MEQIVPLLKDVLGKNFTWQPWLNYTPQQFAESDDVNCKRFVEKVEKHLSFKIEKEFKQKALMLGQEAAKKNQDIGAYFEQIDDPNWGTGQNVEKDLSACIVQ